MGNKRTFVGNVISDKMDKTVVVLVQTSRQHPRYKKYIKFASKFKAHDETNSCGINDKVKIVETRPLSKEKCWNITEILLKAEKSAAPAKRKRVKKA